MLAKLVPFIVLAGLVVGQNVQVGYFGQDSHCQPTTTSGEGSTEGVVSITHTTCTVLGNQTTSFRAHVLSGIFPSQPKDVDGPCYVYFFEGDDCQGAQVGAPFGPLSEGAVSECRYPGSSAQTYSSFWACVGDF